MPGVWHPSDRWRVEVNWRGLHWPHWGSDADSGPTVKLRVENLLRVRQDTRRPNRQRTLFEFWLGLGSCDLGLRWAGLGLTREIRFWEGRMCGGLSRARRAGCGCSGESWWLWQANRHSTPGGCGRSDSGFPDPLSFQLRALAAEVADRPSVLLGFPDTSSVHSL